MQGRLESENKYDEKIQNKLIGMPVFIDEWMSDLKAKGYTGATRFEYLGRVERFFNFLNKKFDLIDPTDITRDQVNRYFISNQTVKKGDEIVETSYSYRNNLYIAMNSLCGFLFDNGYIQTRFNLSKPKNTQSGSKNKKELLTINDFHKILRAVDDNENEFYRKRDKAILAIFMNTGVRKTALQSINKDDIDQENHTLIVIDKGHKEHLYKLNDNTMRIIENWLDYCNNVYFKWRMKNDALFITKDNVRISTDMITKVVMKYTKDGLGKSIRPHQLRAGFCSILYNQTRDIEFVRKAVGHSRLETTQRYIILDEEAEKEKASEIMSQIF